jgi:hypothetical protein
MGVLQKSLNGPFSFCFIVIVSICIRYRISAFVITRKQKNISFKKIENFPARWRLPEPFRPSSSNVFYKTFLNLMIANPGRGEPPPFVLQP